MSLRRVSFYASSFLEFYLFLGLVESLRSEFPLFERMLDR